MGRGALSRFGLDQARLRLLRHEHNTTFRVDADGSRFVLRINRQGVHGPDTIRSELAWLGALTTDTDLGVPEPVTALDGSPVVSVPDGDGTEALAAVLLRWQPGRFVGVRLTPRHLRQVAVLEVGLQRHAERWDRPAGFVRPRVDALTSAARRASVAPSGDVPGPHPTADDVEACLALVDELLSHSDTAIVERALRVVWATTSEIIDRPGASRLIHADLHDENFLFHDGRARAIDFDDCGWGAPLYDLAVTLWELEGRERYDERRDALLEEYAHHLPLPANHHDHLNALFLLRRVQMLMWFLESRNHVAFADWHQSAGAEISEIATALRRVG